MTEREKYIAAMRATADFFEQHPTFDLYTGSSETFCSFPDSKQDFIDHCKMLGSFTKEWTGTNLKVVKVIGGTHRIKVFADRNEFCKRIVTPIHVPATEAFTVKATPAHTKEEITWECPEDLSLIRDDRWEEFQDSRDGSIPTNN